MRGALLASFRPSSGGGGITAVAAALLATALTLSVPELPVHAQSGASGTGSNWAVIVGLDYNWSPNNRLKFTLSDARRFQKFLHAPSANTVFLTDAEDSDTAGGGDAAATPPAARATRENVIQAIRRLAAKARPEDTFWFYFSGHGQFVPETESSFLIPADMKSFTAQGGLRVQQLRTLLSDPSVCRARTKILVLDACESGSSRAWHETSDADGAVSSSSSSTGSGAVKSYTPLAGVVTFAAARPDRSAWETEQEPVAGGIFTYYLCCGLAGASNPDHSAVTLDTLQKYVVSHVDDLCDQLGHPKQEPVFLTPASGSETSASPGAIVVGHYDADALALLQPNHTVDASALHARPTLEPGVILVVDTADHPELADSARAVLKSALIRRGIALYSDDIAPEFITALRDPNRTEQEARRLSARLLLRIHVEATSAPSVSVADMAVAHVAIHAEVTDVYGAVKAVAEASDGPFPAVNSLVKQTLERQIKNAVAKLSADPELLNALPKRRE